MKITFRGWRREVYTHEHPIRPIPSTTSSSPLESGVPVQWCSGLQARGKIEDLGLTGDFLVIFDFEAEELRSWLSQYVASAPEDAVRLLAEMQAEASIALARSMSNNALKADAKRA